MAILEKDTFAIEKESSFGSSMNESFTSSSSSKSIETVTKEGMQMTYESESELPSEKEERHKHTLKASEGASSLPANKYTYTLFQENDGHESDPDGIPTRYLEMQNNKRDKAKTAMEKTLRWRAENDVDTILARPHRKFDVSKKVFPHYFCGRDDTNHVILLQRPGLVNVKLARKNNLTGEELLFHYVYVMEYLWRIIEPAPDATMTSIIDLTGLNKSFLRKREQIKIGKLFLSTMDAHFPQRSHRTLCINAQEWFGALYKIASPLLRESTKQKIQILSKGKKQDEVLKNLLSGCPLPEESKHEAIPPGAMEEDFRRFCLARLEDAGVEMQPVLLVPEEGNKRLSEEEKKRLEYEAIQEKLKILRAEKKRRELVAKKKAEEEKQRPNQFDQPLAHFEESKMAQPNEAITKLEDEKSKPKKWFGVFSNRAKARNR